MRRIFGFASREYIWVRLGKRTFASEGVLRGRDYLLNVFVATSIPFLFGRLALQNSLSWFLVHRRFMGNREILWLRLGPIVFPLRAAPAFECGQNPLLFILLAQKWHSSSSMVYPSKPTDDRLLDRVWFRFGVEVVRSPGTWVGMRVQAL